jgi:hypothetical protein
MFATALDINDAAKVYIIGRRLDNLEEVAVSAVRNPHRQFFSFYLSRR